MLYGLYLASGVLSDDGVSDRLTGGVGDDDMNYRVVREFKGVVAADLVGSRVALIPISDNDTTMLKIQAVASLNIG